VCACKDGDRSVVGTPLTEAETRTLVLCIMHICIRCDVLEKDEDVVGRTTDQRRATEVQGSANVYLYSM
jgi:hypothetical protein